MLDPKIVLTKYFEVLNKQDYDTQIEKDLGEADTIEHFNEALDSVISEMSYEELIKSLKQALKRDTAKGQALGEEDEVWDEMTEWFEEQRE